MTQMLQKKERQTILLSFFLNRRYFMLIFILVSIAGILFVNHDAFLYSQTIGKIVFVKDTSKKDGSLSQQLTLKLLNGTQAGSYDTIENSYTTSFVKSEVYKKGESVFLEKTSYNGKNSYRISSLKRDQYFVYLSLFILGLLFFTVGKRGLRILVSLLGNMLLYMLNLYLYQKGFSLALLTCLFLIIQSIFTLYLLDGYNIKVNLTVLSTLLTVGIVFMIYRFVIAFSTEVPYYMFDYLSVSDNEKRNLFMASVLFGGMGAIMDVAITICSMGVELNKYKKEKTILEYMRILKKTGLDMIGTMQCVLLFSYLTSAVSMMVMKLASGAYLISVLKFDFSFELVRFLTGAIAIVLAVLISTCLCAFYFYGILEKRTMISISRQLYEQYKKQQSKKEDNI